MLDDKHKIQYDTGMNQLPSPTRVQVLSLLVEGNLMRATSQLTGVSINTVTKLLIQAGEACAAYHEAHVKDVPAKRIQCDEIWSFCYAKSKQVPLAKAAPAEAGDVWTWTALESRTKLIVAYAVGDRSAATALAFWDDLRARLANRVQLTTDGYRAYLNAVDGTFGGDVDFSQLVKLYCPTGATSPEQTYSPPVSCGARKRRMIGKPDPAHISTSHVERHNLTMRMSLRRFTRLTNAFSKKLDHHVHMLAVYFLYYNFCRIHTTLRVTPAMAAGLDTTPREMAWIVKLIEARAPIQGPRGPYKKKRVSN